MLFKASIAGDPAATLLVVAYGYQGDNLTLPRFQEAKKRLKDIVDNDDDQRAVIQQALILIQDGDLDGGRQMLEDATQSKPGTELTFSKVFGESNVKSKRASSPEQQDPLALLDSARAWRELGLVRLSTGELNDAIAAFRKAAFDHDDGLAYSYLAFHEESTGKKFSYKWLEYSIKAASCGGIESAFALGMMYGMPFEQIAKQVKEARVRREILNPSRSFNRTSLFGRVFAWPSASFREEGRLHWARTWMELGGMKLHLPSLWERAQFAWRIGGLSGAKLAIKEIISFGMLPKEILEKNPGMKSKAEEQLRTWAATDIGQDALRHLQAEPDVQIPQGLLSLKEDTGRWRNIRS